MPVAAPEAETEVPGGAERAPCRAGDQPSEAQEAHQRVQSVKDGEPVEHRGKGSAVRPQTGPPEIDPERALTGEEDPAEDKRRRGGRQNGRQTSLSRGAQSPLQRKTERRDPNRVPSRQP